MRLLLVVDHWGYTEGLSRNTVSQYLSSAKTHFIQDRAVIEEPSPVWGVKGVLHPLVSAAIKGVPQKRPTAKMQVDTQWFKDGFENCWMRAEFVAIAFIHGWMLRISEATETESAHTIKWSMVHFKVQTTEGFRPLAGQELRRRSCDMVELAPETRKHQEVAREMPGRMNTRHIQDPSQGASTWQDMCQATILQGWALTCGLDTMPQEEQERRPVLMQPGNARIPITPLHVSNALKRQARRHPEREGKMTAHVLRHNGITQIANAAKPLPSATLLAASGHASMKSAKTYIHPGEAMARQVTEAMKAKK
jgi:hypothetical protein